MNIIKIDRKTFDLLALDRSSIHNEGLTVRLSELSTLIDQATITEEECVCCLTPECNHCQIKHIELDKPTPEPEEEEVKCESGCTTHMLEVEVATEYRRGQKPITYEVKVEPKECKHCSAIHCNCPMCHDGEIKEQPSLPEVPEKLNFEYAERYTNVGFVDKINEIIKYLTYTSRKRRYMEKKIWVGKDNFKVKVGEHLHAEADGTIKAVGKDYVRIIYKTTRRSNETI